MKLFRLLALFLFPLVVCTDTNGVVFPYKSVTNTFSYTNAVTNIHTVTQVDYYFTTSNRFDGYVLMSRVPGQQDWEITGRSTNQSTNWIIGTQSPREYHIVLMSRPTPVVLLRFCAR